MKKSLLLALLVVMFYQAVCQNLKLDKVLDVKLQNTGVILSDEKDVKGYYYFYNVEKVDNKLNNYILKVTDENLREINSITITRTKSTILTDAAYNGQAFGFLFYDYKAKTTDLVTYDKSLKELGKSQRVIKGSYNIALYNQVAMGADIGVQFLVGIKNKGFMYYGLVETKKYHYSVDYFDNSCKKIWNMTPDPLSKEILMTEYQFQSDSLVGSTIVKKKGAMSKDMDYDLVVNNLQTGKELFKVEIKDAAFNLSASKIVYDESSKNIMVFGEYFDLNDKEAKASAIGYFYLMLDKSGKTVQKKFISWGKDLSKFVVADKEGRMEKGARVFVHEIIRTADGDVFVIGEQYKKAASGAGIAMAALGGGRSRTSTAQLVTMNMVVLQFSSSLDIKGVHIFDKDKNTYLLPAGAEFWSPKMLAYYGLTRGWFDYNYYQILKDKNTFVVTYNNYVKEKGEKGQSILAILVYTPEKVFTLDKVVLNRKSSQCQVGIAKSGYVMVAEYFKKEKTLDVRLEKINY